MDTTTESPCLPITQAVDQMVDIVGTPTADQVSADARGEWTCSESKGPLNEDVGTVGASTGNQLSVPPKKRGRTRLVSDAPWMTHRKLEPDYTTNKRSLRPRKAPAESGTGNRKRARSNPKPTLHHEDPGNRTGSNASGFDYLVQAALLAIETQFTDSGSSKRATSDDPDATEAESGDSVDIDGSAINVDQPIEAADLLVAEKTVADDSTEAVPRLNHDMDLAPAAQRGYGPQANGGFRAPGWVFLYSPKEMEAAYTLVQLSTLPRVSTADR